MPSILKARTLATFKNKLSIPEGSLLTADNIVIDQDNIITPRRGFKSYSCAAACCACIKAIFEYKDRIIRHHGTTLEYDCCSTAGCFTAFSGSYTEPETGIRIKSVEANSNLYFTTTDGIKKISGTLNSCCNTNFTTAANFISDAGAPKALDITGVVSYSCGAFLSGLSKTAYRVVWGYRDNNNNLLLGAPSSRLVISNTTCCEATVCLTFSIPTDVNSTCYFYQVYRTGVTTACCACSLSCIDPGDEMNLVLENNLTTGDISAGTITINDPTIDTFRESGVLLYTNPVSGCGILQANDKPPYAKDITSFRNSVFYANTATLENRQFNLLSVSKMTSGQSSFIVGNSCSTKTYTFYGQTETTQINVLDQASITCGSYFLLNSASDERKYGFWLHTCACACLPCACDLCGRILKKTLITACDSQASVACKLQTTINNESDFTATTGSTVATIPFTCIIPPCGTFLECGCVPSNGEIGRFTTTGILPTGICACTNYYVVCQSGFTFKVSTTACGCPVIMCDTGSGCHTFTTNFVTVSTVKSGNVTDAIDGCTSTCFTFNVTTQGDGECSCNNHVLLSSLTSAAQSIDESARSLVSMINQDACGIVNAFYLSGEDDLPGIIRLEAKSLSDCTFYIAQQDDCVNISCQFCPKLPKSQAVTSFAAACCCTKTLVTMPAAHGFVDNNCVFIYNTTNCTCGVYSISCVVCCACCTIYTFKVTGTLTETCARVFIASRFSTNEEAKNRLYFSKVSQPEAVPLTNYIDIGAKDKAIERIIALRDNLFVLKEDGVYIVTGDVAPNFTPRLLDGSIIILAPDSAAVLNNQIYLLSTQGIASASDTGISVVSREIEDEILKVTKSGFNFRTASFGVASESDRAYHIWLPTTSTDTIGTQAFRYNTFTRGWVRWTICASAGLVNSVDDKIYLAKGSKVHQERKNSDRTDHADDQFCLNVLEQCAVACSKQLTLSSSTNVTAGDVLTQCQYITIAKFNRLLRKLDNDTGLDCTDYLSTLELKIGNNVSTKLASLVTKIDADDCSTCYTTPTGGSMCQDKTDFNTLSCELNGSVGTTFRNYCTITDLTQYEGIITAVCSTTNTVTLESCIPFLNDSITHYKGISSEIKWPPQHFGDPSITKQIPEGTIQFDGNNFYSATIAYSTDLSRDVEEVDFFGRGPGYWGGGCYGNTTWGGCGTDVPIRTLIPKQKQRCRYILTTFKHKNARETFKILGFSLEARRMSNRGYKKI